ncbi:hypothetical protein AgCh_010168 [Apium graveolens]
MTKHDIILVTSSFATCHHLPIRRSGRVSRQPERYYGLVIENDNELSIIDDDDPVTYNEAMSSVDSEKWHSAMKSELESMYTNQVWTLVEAPEGVNPIGCNPVKINSDFLAIAAYYDYEIWKMDVKTAFLNGKLEEEVYMT